MKVVNYRELKKEREESAPGVTVRWAITDKDGAPNFAMRIFEVEAGAATPFHAHPWEHEVFVLGGAGALRSEDGEQPLSEGDVVFVPPQERHQFVNRGSGVLQFICVIPWPVG